jgi:MFS family permease
LVTFFGLPEGELLSTNEHTIRKKNKRSLIEIVKIIVSKPELLFYMSVNTSFGINWGIKSFLWPLVIFQLAKNDLVTGSVFATMGFLASLLLPFAGRFVDRFGSYRMILFELVILGTSGVGLALSGSITFFWVCAAIYTVGEVVNGPAQAVLLTENIGQDMRGEMMGLDATLDQLLAVLSPFLAGFCITIFGLTYTLLIFMLLFWMSFMLSGYIYITKIRKHF